MARLIVFVLVGVAMPVLLALGCYLWVSARAASRVFSDPARLPPRPAALVLGTAKATSRGGENHYFTGRIDAAATLLARQGVQRLILSGADRLPVRQAQAAAMAAACQARGIAAGCLVQDARGYRTWDSMWICLHDLGCRDPVVVSQRFHVERAVFIGLHMGMDPVGFAAARIGGRAALRMFLRECLARVRCVLDCYLLRPDPVYRRRPRAETGGN